MIRCTLCIPALALALFPVAAMAQPDLSAPPATYELRINGEEFRVEGDRPVKLKSKKDPTTAYDVAISISPIQVLRLNTVALDYGLPAKVTDDRGRQRRGVQIKHELGFSLLINDLGKPLEAKERDETLDVLIDYVKQTAKERKSGEVTVAAPHDKDFRGSSGRGVAIRYQDIRQLNRGCLVYVLGGEKFAATAVCDYLDKDAEDALPWFKKVLDSVRPLPGKD